MSAGKQWTREEDDKLREMYEAHVPVVEMAARLHRGKKGVEHRARVLDLSRARGKDWSEEEVETLRRLWADGVSSREIGSLMKRGQMKVLDRAKALGLPSRASTRQHLPKTDQICKACTIKLEFVANCPIAGCEHFTGYVDPYERTLAGVSGGWVANG